MSFGERGTPQQEREINLLESFSYKKPDPEAASKHMAVETDLRKAAVTIIEQAPDCADRTTALRCLREARMWANAAIALKGTV